MLTYKLKSFFNKNLPASVCSFLLLTGFYFNAFGQQQKVSDKAIENAVEADLWIDDMVDMNNINVTVNDGIVNFSGKADNIMIKDRVVDVAENIRGVRGIINLISVDTNFDRSDLEIRRDITSALFRDPAADSYEIRVEVDDKKATLEGTVQSWAEKQLTENVVKGVKGVRDIQNNIKIEYRKERSDYEIEQDIKGRLANDVRVFDSLIEVQVEDGNVVLGGTVGSLSEKNRAVSDAWVAGVTDVTSEKLTIEWWARDNFSRKKMTVRTDDEIRKAVKDAFIYDPRIFSFNPEINVDNGVVTLNGVVDNYMAKVAAEQDAKNTIGVIPVQNYLKVRPVTVLTNEKLEEQVETALTNDPYIERFELTVDATNGIVYLSGDVNTSFEKEHAENIVKRINGVTDVLSSVSYDYQWVWKPDWEIKKDLEQQLKWSVFVDADQIDVSVSQGVVELSGKADTWIEYNAAEKNAYEAGAKDVVNNLDVLHNNYGPFYYWGFLHY